ncbi:MAG: hypothetical protein OEY51_07575 [Cyclobacteriaceae bacterium]|nr:hypothetical protein [Cyclobacteriaceae bacterium]
MDKILVKSIPLLFVGLVWFGCKGNYNFEYDTIITDVPVNLEKINSGYDDYNSDLPYPAFRYGIYFSSNRRSGGNNFDIIHEDLDISYHEKDDVLNVTFPTNTWDGENQMLSVINSSFDELGPLSLFGPNEYSYFFFANNEEGNYNVKYTYFLKSDFGTSDGKGIINGPENLMVINSDKDDMYPAINMDNSSLFFCSNRDNDQFDIYSIALPNEVEFDGFIRSTTPGVVIKNDVLSSNFDDKCPSINEDLMVFASNREGGYGGYDLYFSRWINGAWSIPKNFGAGINSEFDEYRPITFHFFEGFEHIMIFSSDRPGGKGGFDLYMVQADDIVN